MDNERYEHDIDEMNRDKSTVLQEEKEKKRNTKKSVIKTVAICLSIIFAVFFSTLSWFTMSRETETKGIDLNAADCQFKIATKGTNVRNEEILSSKRPEYLTGTSQILTDTDNSQDTYYISDSLKLRFTPANGLPKDIHPGSSEELSLYIIPESDSPLNLKVSLNVSAFAAIEKYNENNEPVIADGKIQTEIIEIKDRADFISKANAVHNSEAAAAAADYVKAAEYLNGHIMFFGGKGNTTTDDESTRFYFTDPYTEKHFTKEIAGNNKNKAVKLPVYWMWTNTFGQIALPDNVSKQRDGYPILSDTDTDKSKVITYLKNNKTAIFVNCDSNTENDITSVATHVDDISDFDETAFEKLSIEYNKADNIIGKKISYFLIEVTVEEA